MKRVPDNIEDYIECIKDVSQGDNEPYRLKCSYFVPLGSLPYTIERKWQISGTELRDPMQRKSVFVIHKSRELGLFVQQIETEIEAPHAGMRLVETFDVHSQSKRLEIQTMA